LAGNSLDGLARFRAEPWHVVCTNRNRAGLNGDEFAREIKLLSPATPVILMTRNPPASVGTCVDAVLLKPFTCAALGAVISHCLGLYPQRRDYALSNRHSHEG
jgi:DNA-binding NtrC family response regulator